MIKQYLRIGKQETLASFLLPKIDIGEPHGGSFQWIGVIIYAFETHNHIKTVFELTLLVKQLKYLIISSVNKAIANETTINVLIAITLYEQVNQLSYREYLLIFKYCF